MAVFSRSVFRLLKPGFHVIADDRKSQIASNRRRSQKRTFPYNLKNRRADRGHTFRSAEMWNKHAQLQSKTCQNNMENIEEGLLLLRANVFLLSVLKRQRRQLQGRRKHQYWIRSIFLQRQKLGDFHTLVKELRTSDREYFFRYMRMSPERFDYLLSLVTPFITKDRCRSRTPISASARLWLCLRYHTAITFLLIPNRKSNCVKDC